MMALDQGIRLPRQSTRPAEVPLRDWLCGCLSGVPSILGTRVAVVETVIISMQKPSFLPIEVDPLSCKPSGRREIDSQWSERFTLVNAQGITVGAEDPNDIG
jgi:hypothetical protein